MAHREPASRRYVYNQQDLSMPHGSATAHGMQGVSTASAVRAEPCCDAAQHAAGSVATSGELAPVSGTATKPHSETVALLPVPSIRDKTSTHTCLAPQLVHVAGTGRGAQGSPKRLASVTGAKCGVISADTDNAVHQRDNTQHNRYHSSRCPARCHVFGCFALSAH